MVNSRALLLFACTAAAGVSCKPKIVWGPCDDVEFAKAPLPVQCGSIPVPYDYTSPNSSTFDLEIVRIPAATNNSRGSILHNFGGPGAEARQTLALALGPLLQQLSGGEYDLVAFDPRGTGKTIPFNCVNNTALETEMLMGSLISVDSRENMGRMWARGGVNSYICQTDPNGVGQFVGTAFTARDFIRVVDALGEDSMLRYWGFSYGTTLGATLASMFPERVDRMIIDGVQNPHEYYHAFADFEEWSDTDEALRTMFRACIAAGPEACPLASHRMSAEELETETYTILDDLQINPIALGGLILDHFLAKAFIAEGLKAQTSWPGTTAIIDALFRHDLVTLNALFMAIAEEQAIDRPIQALESLWSIHCGDREPRAKSLADIQPAFEKLQNTSKLVGAAFAPRTAICARWPFEAKERVSGDFQAKTKNPMLIVGNTIDGHTPLRSALNVSDGFDGSVVLEVNGTGHCSINLPSACVAEKTINYWLEGVLPGKGEVCQVDALPFSATTWADVFEGMGLAARSMLKKRDGDRIPGYLLDFRWF
ncbi:TAP-like protein-domain-containing protein [Plectosphaerella plurivora]|uniref:TAP-like protein-domain-containing protein n=1 Tax=Plectosphaerella plurivora TaxID=936078 RepID=A0A9P9AFZ9_9PEZI|nr:TAP-like protein-domain-containing protein [Plectosphaerella plurivora]